MGPVALIGLTVATLTNSLDMGKESLSGFSSNIVWLVVFVFFIARGFIKTQLGARIAYLFLSVLGKRTLGIGYGLILTELLIAPAIPSNSARAGGVMFPVIKSIAESLGSCPSQGTERRVGSFLVQVCFNGNLITSAMFLTAMAANPLAQSIAAKQGIVLTWGDWALAACVPGLLSIILVPLFLYYVYPPQVRVFPEAVSLAHQKLRELGPMSRQEFVMLGSFFTMLTLWILADFLKVHPCTTALLGVCILLITKVLDWKDILNESEAWHTFVWLAILITLSTYLEKYGMVGWFSQIVGGWVTGFGTLGSFLILTLVYFYSHYFFASNAAHVSAMYATFLSVLISIGAPPVLSALVLGFFSSLFSTMTHYGSSAGVILYGMGYVSTKDWWKLGFFTSLLNIAIWLGFGGVWWKILGLW